MSNLYNAMNRRTPTNMPLTANGAVTNSTSGNSNVDLFFTAGAARNADITPTFAAALSENAEVAGRVLLWTRDVRGGAGERSTFRKLFAYLIENDIERAQRVLARIPELGRWDDVFVAMNTRLESQALAMLEGALENGDGLAAKWIPRKGEVFNKLRRSMDITPKQLRKTLVSLSSTVEQQMCANDWDNINFEHVPSVASSRYRKAFKRHGVEKYEQYVEAVSKGEAKMNASVIYPYEILRSLKGSGYAYVADSITRKSANAHWESLPNYLEGNTEDRILPVVDVSGSMYTNISGSVQAIDASVSLGIYLAERLNGPFKDYFMTFSHSPKMRKVTGSDIYDKVDSVLSGDVGYNTDLMKTFRVLLTKARQNDLSEEDMPTKLLIISDMEFDSATQASYYSRSQDRPETTNFEAIRAEYAKYGYRMPKIVFWNVNGRAGNVPVTIRDEHTALVSGFSPSIMKSLLSGELSPEGIMNKTVMKDRYAY